MVDGMATDSVWYQMCADRAVELAEDPRLTPEQIAARTGLSADAVRKIRKRKKAREAMREKRGRA